MLAKLPVDIVIGKMLIMGTVFHVSRYFTVIKNIIETMVATGFKLGVDIL